MYRDAFSLPKMSVVELGNDDFNSALIEIQSAKILFSIYCLPGGDHKCLYTGVGQKELGMLIQAIHRNTQIYKLLKLAFINIDQLREDDINNDNFELLSIQYLNLKTMLRSFTIPSQDNISNESIPSYSENESTKQHEKGKIEGF